MSCIMRQPVSTERISRKLLLLLCVFLKVSDAQSFSPCNHKATINTSAIVMDVNSCTIVNNSYSSLTITTGQIALYNLSPGTTYRFEMNCSGTYCYNVFTIWPDAVRNLSVTQITTSSVSLNWSQPQGNSSFYSVEWTDSSTNRNQTTNKTYFEGTDLISGTNYTFSVIAFAANGQTKGSSVNVSQFTIPEAIWNLSVTQTTESTVSLSWSEPRGNRSLFKVDWNGGKLSTGIPSAVATNLVAGTSYTFRVVAVAADNRTEGAPVSKTQYTLPARPENISATYQGNGSLNVSWSLPGGNVTEFEVNITNTRLNFTSNQTVSAYTISLSGLQAGLVYNLTVTSVIGILRSSSEMAQIATKPNPPGEIRTKTKTNSSISLEWDKPAMDGAAEVSYNITYQSTQSAMVQSTTSSNSSVQLFDLASGTKYRVSVETVGPQDLRSRLVFQHVCTLPNPVLNLRSSPLSVSSVSLEWESPVGVQQNYTYWLQISNATGPGWNLTVANNSAEIRSLQPGTMYNFSVTTVASCNAVGSPVYTLCYTKPKVVTDLKAVAASSTSLNLTWTRQDDHRDAYSYLVFSSEPGSVTQNRTTPNETVVISDLVPGANYTLTVVTVMDVVQSDPATTSNFTKPEKAVNVKAVGTERNMTVTWDRPRGYITSYRITISQNGSLKANQTSLSNVSVVFSGLWPGQIYDVIITACSGPFQVPSEMVQNATYPTPPSFIRMDQQTTDSISVVWGNPIDMDSVQYHFIVYLQGSVVNSTNNSVHQNNLTSGTKYNFTVMTVGKMDYQSLPLSISISTKPGTVSDLRGMDITTSEVTLIWKPPDSWDGYSYLSTVELPNGTTGTEYSTNSTNVTIVNLQSGSNYTFTVTVVGPSGVKSFPVSIPLFTRPNPIGGLSCMAFNTTVVLLDWTKPLEYKEGYSYRVETTERTSTLKNLTVHNVFALVAGLIPGTNYSFSIYSQAANGIEGKPVSCSNYTKPGRIDPVVSSEGANDSITVRWDPPKGHVEKYVVNLTSGQGVSSLDLEPGNRSWVFSSLAAAKIYTVTMVTVSGPFTVESGPVTNATYPNKPGAITIKAKTTDSISVEWGSAPGMDTKDFDYVVTYLPNMAGRTNVPTNHSVVLSDLASGTSYNISVATSGPMGFMSEPVEMDLVTTKPEMVQSLEASTYGNTVMLKWKPPSVFKKGYYYRVVQTADNSPNATISDTTLETNYEVNGLIQGNGYNFSVTTMTSDATESSRRLVYVCTDTAPVADLACWGPNLTAASLNLVWSNPTGFNKGFRIQAADQTEESVPTCAATCSHNVTGLSYSKVYSVHVWTQGCGKSSNVTKQCKTGVTVPPVPDTNAFVVVTGKEYNRFTLKLSPGLFNNASGPIVNYGVLVTSSVNNPSAESSDSLKKYLNKTYEDWNAGRVATYLAFVWDTESTNRNGGNEPTLSIGDSAHWYQYNNGPLSAKGIYRFSVVLFTHLEMQDGLVHISESFFSISAFYQEEISLPENPAVIGAVSGAVVSLIILIIAIISLAFIVKRRSRQESSDVPIHSLSDKVSVPVRVEDFKDYYRKQRANSNCGFAEEFENLKPVGVTQAKSSALAPENKGKNRYNNVLPYDPSRVKLSTNGSPYDDYINASYMPGYNSKKEFIAAQGPLPSTVNEFWRMIWEKNVHTLVMLTRCNELGRVKCEEYWPSGTMHFNNITVTTTSEIPLEDWTLRDFNVKNVKTAESRCLRHFHFTAWPDHGVPETTELLINFRHLVREHMDQYSRHSPAVVHCSAGVGRTGTFIAIDRLIFQIERESVVDVYGTIHDLRMHRPLMVQTEDQYVFLNQCAMDIIRSRTGTNVDLIYQNTAALSIYENFEPMEKSKNGYHHA